MQVISGNCRSISKAYRYFFARKLIDQQTLERKLQNNNNNSEINSVLLFRIRSPCFDGFYPFTLLSDFLNILKLSLFKMFILKTHGK